MMRIYFVTTFIAFFWINLIQASAVESMGAFHYSRHEHNEPGRIFRLNIAKAEKLLRKRQEAIDALQKLNRFERLNAMLLSELSLQDFRAFTATAEREEVVSRWLMTTAEVAGAALFHDIPEVLAVLGGSMSIRTSRSIATFYSRGKKWIRFGTSYQVCLLKIELVLLLPTYTTYL